MTVIRLRSRESLRLVVFCSGLVLIYLTLWCLSSAFPYLRAGSDIILRAKLHDESRGLVFPKSPSTVKVAVFGNSIILSGLEARHFDELAAAQGIRTYTYNAGIPGRLDFVPELKNLETVGDLPNIILLTAPWESSGQANPLSLPISDIDLANMLFPFRSLVRDTASFMLTAHEKGGIRAFYEASADNVVGMRKDHGWYFIKEQSHYEGDSLPDNFVSPFDHPGTVDFRTADVNSKQLIELSELVRRHSILCLYVPKPVRSGSAAAPPDFDAAFERLLEAHTPCRQLGPDYLLYPNRNFSDLAHLNPVGARIYTQDLFTLVRAQFLSVKKD
jgi:hypothetical protein